MSTKEESKHDELMEQDDLNEPVFENGPTRKEVEEWKKEYGRIYYIFFDEDTPFIWRRLRRAEYREILSKAEDRYTNEEIIARKCVLYPKNVDELLEEQAGFATVLCDQIMEHSGFSIKSAPIEL